MDVFEVLKAISKRKRILTESGVTECEASSKAELDISEEYHISLLDIKKLNR